VAEPKARSPAAREVTLETAEPGDAPLLANLLELYVHDLSEIFSIGIGEDGRFGYEKLSLYWRERERRFPFLIRAGGELAGFVLATRGSPATDDPADLDVAEFFVLRRNRREGVGRRAAFLLWRRLPGHWIVRVSEGNHGALPFWHGVISEYTGGGFSRRTLPGTPHPWSVFAFESAPAATGV
jgi:predicted acetyltransferase